MTRRQLRVVAALPGGVWQVYILRCADDTLYTGIARNAELRVAEHNAGGRRSARYTRGRRPVTLVYVEIATDRAAASRREHQIKALERGAKLELIGRAASGPAPRKRRAPPPHP